MKKELTEIVLILDESGSMQSQTGKVLEGYNEFIDLQKKTPGEAKFTLIKFDTKYDIVYNGIDIKNVPLLTNEIYQPGGMTALLDATGRAIDEVGKRLSNLNENERPEKVIFCIITDGEENSSREYTSKQVSEKIAHQEEKYNWQFIFIGANQDSWDTANSLNIGSSNIRGSGAVNYSQDNINVTLKAASTQINSFRTNNNTTFADTQYLYNMSKEELDNEINLDKNE